MKTDQSSQKKKSVSLAALLRNLDKISYFRVEWIAANIPYLVFVMILGFVYIYNNHRGVGMVKELRNTEERMTEAKWEYNNAKNELTRYSRQSTVAERVQDQQMYELTNPPYTILEK